MEQNTVLIALTIDENLRTIAIPTNGVVFGVVGDVEVNRVQFVLPRYFRGFDLTEFTARVNYANPNGDANYYEADDIQDTDGNCTFTWLMGSDVTAYIGDVKFSITLYKKEGDTVVHRFGTRPATGRVLEGYSVEETVTPAQQKTLVEKISEEVKASLPDYNDLEESISQNTTDLNNLSTKVNKNSSNLNTLQTSTETNTRDINNITSILGLPEVIKSMTSYPIHYGNTTIFSSYSRPQFLYTDNLFGGLSKNVAPITWCDSYDNQLNLTTDRYLTITSVSELIEYHLHLCDSTGVSDDYINFPVRGVSYPNSVIAANILYLGDDLLVDGKIIKSIDTWLRQHNISPNYLGSLVSDDGINHECRKKFNSYYYGQAVGPNPNTSKPVEMNVENPFYNNGHFDIDYYMNRYYSSIDNLIVVINLCRNEYQDVETGLLSTSVNDELVFGHLVNIINQIIFKSNKIKVLALTDISPCSYTPYGRAYIHHITNTRIASLLTNRIYPTSKGRDQLYILPTHLLNDPIYGFVTSKGNDNMYVPDSVLKYCSDPMKLSDAGCEQIASAIGDAIIYLAQQA